MHCPGINAVGEILSDKFAVVGLSWWGLGPEEMALELTHAGMDCDAFVLWDIRRRVDRKLMDSPLGFAEGARRARSIARSSQGGYRAVFVTSPHRYTAAMLRTLKTVSIELIALLGDEPVGVRAVKRECWDIFDRILAADERWLLHIPPTGAHRGTMPWGSTLMADELLEASPYRPESLVIIGAPYSERIELAERLAQKFPLTLQGDGWPALPGVRRRPASSRLETMTEVRRSRELVVNIHHSQFARGINPQFFDYAAAAIPQVVVHADDLDRFRLCVDNEVLEGYLSESDVLHDSDLASLNERVIRVVRRSYMFHSCIRRAVT